MTTALQLFYAAFVGGMTGAIGTDLIQRWRRRQAPARTDRTIVVGPTEPCLICGKPDSPVVGIVACRDGSELNIHSCARHRNTAVAMMHEHFGGSR